MSEGSCSNAFGPGVGLAEQFGIAMKKVGVTPDQLHQAVGDPAKLAALAAVLRGELSLPSDLLEPVATVSLPAVARFSAAEYFRDGKTTSSGVKIWLSETICSVFLGDNAKVETEVPAANLRVHCLRRGSLDAPIIAELGGEQVVEIALANLAEMLDKQDHGQPGDLLVNGYANIFYVRDSRGTLWAVDCYWSSAGGGWGTYADSVSVQDEWSADCQVISR